MHTLIRFHLVSVLLMAISLAGASSPDPASRFETVHTSNAAILNRLGLTPLQIPDGHHKKRLAGPEPPGLTVHAGSRIHQPYSRRHGHRDSHIYIVKLPASPPYYTIAKPHKPSKEERSKPGPGSPVGFHGNGKPAKIYHWNLPLVKKIGEKKRLQARLRMEQATKKLDGSRKRQQAQNGESNMTHQLAGQDDHQYHQYRDNRLPQTGSLAAKHARNNDKRLGYHPEAEKKPVIGKKVPGNASEKTYRLDDSALTRIRATNEIHGPGSAASKAKKHRKKAAMSYYAPIPGKTGSTSIHKSFPGNGKPKAFYVMEKSRKPVYYHPLLP